MINTMYIIGQVMGFIALLFTVISFQCKKRENILFYQIFCSIFYSLSLLFLGAITGALSMMITIVRNFVFSQKGKKKWASHNAWLFIFLFIVIITGIITYKNLYSILPIIGTCLGTLAFWMTKPSHIRYIAVVIPPIWMIYNIAFGSIGGVILESFYLLSVLTGIIRFDILKQTDKENANI
ncbi:MAG: YgjV family protein [Ignavibacteriales bacterium]